MKSRYKGTGRRSPRQDSAKGRGKTVPREDRGPTYSNDRGRSGNSGATAHLRRFAGEGTGATAAAGDTAPAPVFRAGEADPIRGR